MINLKIGIAPFVVEIPVDEKNLFQEIIHLIRRLLKRKNFNGYYFIIAKHSKKALDVDHASKEDCANVFQYTHHGGDSQQWILVQNPDDYYHIFSKHSNGKCLDVEGSKKDNCANVWQYSFHGGDNQKWKLEKTKDGYFNIIAKHSGKALDVAGSGQEDTVNVLQYDRHTGENQKWDLVQVK